MLDNGTKKRIDSARDILVGKVPDPKSQVEQITIAMIYKFMDDMDNQTEELGGKATFFTGEFKQYAWSRLLDRKFSGHERMLLYAEGIEKMNINEITGQIIGAAIEVHKQLGPGLLESAYEECLAYELQSRHIPIERQKPITAVYKEVRLECGFRLDFLVQNSVIV